MTPAIVPQKGREALPRREQSGHGPHHKEETSTNDQSLRAQTAGYRDNDGQHFTTNTRKGFIMKTYSNQVVILTHFIGGGL